VTDVTTTEPAPPATPTKGELTRQSILDAAIERFGREGYRATSVADIARDAGVSGTAAYAYFAGKEALFLAAVDHDTASVIHEGISLVGATGAPRVLDRSFAVTQNWRQSLVFALVDSLDRHPLARRLLGGLEPEASARVLDIPALNDLRRACADQLRAEQAAGLVRADVDTEVLGRGVVAILLSLLMSVTQLGVDATLGYAADVTAVFDAALQPPAAPTA
jgi:AcrR family transcriptional regulator